jgi:Uncharacterised protein family (UPF0158)
MITIPADKLREIAQDLDAGMKCYYHLETGETVATPDDSHFDEFDDELLEELMEEVEKAPEKYLVFEPMDSQQSFRLMEGFVENIADKNTSLRFQDAIAFRKPFQNFKQLLGAYPELREQWFVYKDQEHVEWVKEQLEAMNLSDE